MAVPIDPWTAVVWDVPEPPRAVAETAEGWCPFAEFAASPRDATLRVDSKTRPDFIVDHEAKTDELVWSITILLHRLFWVFTGFWVGFGVDEVVKVLGSDMIWYTLDGYKNGNIQGAFTSLLGCSTNDYLLI